MPRRRGEELRALLGKHLLPMPLSLPPLELHLYWHRQSDSEPLSQWLRTELLSLASALLDGSATL